MTETRDLAILIGKCHFKESEIWEFQRLKYASENSIRQISGFVLLLMLMSRVFSIAYAHVTGVLNCLCF